MLNKLWEALVRFRVWVVNLFGAALLVLPELLNAPEIIALVPQSSQKWVFAAALLLNIWMRPRPAVIASDPEAEITRLRKGLAK